VEVDIMGASGTMATSSHLQQEERHNIEPRDIHGAGRGEGLDKSMEEAI
jgi:hypothetical protein